MTPITLKAWTWRTLYSLVAQIEPATTRGTALCLKIERGLEVPVRMDLTEEEVALLPLWMREQSRTLGSE